MYGAGATSDQMLFNQHDTQWIEPGGEFEMGDHHNSVDLAHPSDELPVHRVWISPLFAGAAYDAIRVNCGITGEDSAGSPA